MPLSTTIPQAFLATAIGLSAAGIRAGTKPPNPSPDEVPATGDSMRVFVVIQQKYGNILYFSLGIAALHHASLVVTYPNIPASLLRHACINGLKPSFVTWSKDTAIPLAFILVGTSLRLLSYGALGKNFTFSLSEPDDLNTSGLYRYMQHPSYTGVLAMIVGVLGLWGRLDGLLSCFIPPRLFSGLRRLQPGALSLVFAAAIAVIWERVKDEERMLRNTFGSRWEAWHSRTARFIPFIF
ncbi:hypothetical protein GQX73_g2440 [Xylaria multiplex]|uniref:Protein-S-isoprenylcysteine O-methyltransferase n=1 Tax=Xylaria multiplex TaxID=323545 RepID=A0A7C8IWV4_9PEZI|nr:hypothetical protein GQX73_g2440 [Xylaria multiplex]